MVTPEIPTSTPTATPAAPPSDSKADSKTDSNAESNSDFVAMLTQLLGNTDAALPAASNQIKGADAKDTSTDPTAIDPTAIDPALIDSLAALLANAAPLISQAMAQMNSDRATSTDPSATATSTLTSAITTAMAGALNGAATGAAAESITLAANMLANGAATLARDSQALLQANLGDAGAKTLISDSAKKHADAGVTPDGSNNVNSISTNNNAQADASRVDMQIKSQVGTSAWHDEVGAKLTWMIERGVQSGSLRLSPENLGPLEVKISIQHDQATVWFGAAHADTRASLEQALPRLREMFAASGLSLADAGVFKEPPKEAFKNSSNSYASRNDTEVISGVATIGAANGLLDAYA